jgi:hypothetical protein
MDRKNRGKEVLQKFQKYFNFLSIYSKKQLAQMLKIMLKYETLSINI